MVKYIYYDIIYFSLKILETLILSDKIIKINRYNMSQERNIIITNKAVYNLKKKGKLKF